MLFNATETGGLVRSSPCVSSTVVMTPNLYPGIIPGGIIEPILFILSNFSIIVNAVPSMPTEMPFDAFQCFVIDYFPVNAYVSIDPLLTLSTRLQQPQTGFHFIVYNLHMQ